ncbi:MAG: hypothetical protein M0C28_12715 [Candidatus Moduliflexus flocculans]|nr:hypothetical protein [Candidatus Moduliflexus flocculans]
MSDKKRVLIIDDDPAIVRIRQGHPRRQRLRGRLRLQRQGGPRGLPQDEPRHRPLRHDDGGHRLGRPGDQDHEDGAPRDARLPAEHDRRRHGRDRRPGRVRLQRRLPEARQLRPAPGRHRPVRQGQVAPAAPAAAAPPDRPDRPMSRFPRPNSSAASPTPTSFRRAVLALGGDFPFGSADMIELRRGLFRALPRPGPGPQRGRGPSSATPWPVPPSSRRPSWPSDPARRDAYRDMLDDVARVGPDRRGPRRLGRPRGPAGRPRGASTPRSTASKPPSTRSPRA